MRILALDPGFTTGWALAQLDHKMPEGFKWVRTGDVLKAEYFAFLQRAVPKIEVLVCEDFVIRTEVHKWAATRNTDNDLPISKMVGAAQYAAFINEKPCILQEPNNKRLGYTLCGLPWEPKSKKKIRHQWDAMSHARVYMRKALDI